MRLISPLTAHAHTRVLVSEPYPEMSSSHLILVRVISYCMWSLLVTCSGVFRIREEGREEAGFKAMKYILLAFLDWYLYPFFTLVLRNKID